MQEKADEKNRVIKQGNETAAVVIPTLNAEKELDGMLQMLRRQSRRPDKIIVVDSGSTDDTVCIADSFREVTLYRIGQDAFDHGGTRDFALRQANSDFVIFLTQDAIPAEESYIEKILAPFRDPEVAAVSGRQLPKPEARPFEKLVRLHNYPAESSVWSADDKARLGVRAYALSDANAAYRTEAYLAVGGFDTPIPTNEDMLIAEKFIRFGYKLAYCADAPVYHSHNFTLAQQYRRYRLIGRVMEMYKDRLQVSGKGYGFNFVVSISGELIKTGHVAECAAFLMDCAARYLGNIKGKHSA